VEPCSPQSQASVAAGKFEEAAFEQFRQRLERWKRPETGLLAQLRKRQSQAEALLELDNPNQAALWTACQERIDSNDRYSKLQLPKQLGLIPLGPDPISRLEEFAVALTGEIPPRDEEGKLRLDASSAMVLVLIPAGSYWIGTQIHHPESPNYTDTKGNVTPSRDETDLSAPGKRSSAIQVKLAPFFIGKHEVTQAQWERLGAPNPSQFIAGTSWKRRDIEIEITPMNPVERVSHTEAMTWLTRYGLTLPTEAQWEAAARAGDGSTFGEGIEEDEVELLVEYANFLDRSRYRAYWTDPRDKQRMSFWLDDGYAVHAPIGSFKPNSFGLHDVLGNVSEHCLDYYAMYRHAEARRGDGLRKDPEQQIFRVVRGSNYDTEVYENRPANRLNGPEDNRGSKVGLRAARKIERL
jgi:sulfatase modifying factor 1